AATAVNDALRQARVVTPQEGGLPQIDPLGLNDAFNNQLRASGIDLAEAGVGIPIELDTTGFEEQIQAQAVILRQQFDDALAIGDLDTAERLAINLADEELLAEVATLKESFASVQLDAATAAGGVE